MLGRASRQSQQRAAGRRQRIGGLAVEAADGCVEQVEPFEPLEHVANLVAARVERGRDVAHGECETRRELGVQLEHALLVAAQARFLADEGGFLALGAAAAPIAGKDNSHADPALELRDAIRNTARYRAIEAANRRGRRDQRDREQQPGDPRQEACEGSAVVGSTDAEELGDGWSAAREQIDAPVAGQEEPLLERRDGERAVGDERIRWSR